MSNNYVTPHVWENTVTLYFLNLNRHNSDPFHPLLLVMLFEPLISSHWVYILYSVVFSLYCVLFLGPLMKVCR